MKNKNVIYVISIIITIFLLSGCSDLLTYNPNRSPVSVVAQENFTVYPGVVVRLDGSKSSDVDNQLLRYVWEAISSPTDSPFSLTEKDSDVAFFQTSYYAANDTPYTAPSPTYFGSYRVKLTIYDEYDVTDSKYIDIQVANLSPTATIVWSGSAPAPGASVTLDGSTSDDPDPDKRNGLSYSWSVTDQPKSTEWQWNTEGYGNTSFIPSPVTTSSVDFSPGTVGLGNGGEGVYTLRMNVTDEYGSTDNDSIIIETSGNTAPNAAATVDVTNNGSATANSCTNVDTTPATIAGEFVTGVGPLFELDALPSDNTGATRNLEQDTLTYSWTIDGFVGKKALQLGGNIIEYSPNDELTTDTTFSFRPVESSQYNDDVAVATDFTITLKVSDGIVSKDDSLVLNFDVDSTEGGGNTAPTAAASVTVTNYGEATTYPYTDQTIDITSSGYINADFNYASTSWIGPEITLDGTPSNSAANNVEGDTLSYKWVISGFTGTKSIQIGSSTANYSSGDTLSFASVFSFKPTDRTDITSEAGAAVDFIITLTVSDGTSSKDDDLILKFDID